MHYSEKIGFGQPIMCLRRHLTYADFVDSGATGTFTFTEKLPVGALVLGWAADVIEAFTPTTTMLMTVGVTGTTAMFTGVSAGPSVATAAKIGAAASSDGTYGSNVMIATAIAPVVTLTDNADFTVTVTAKKGALDVFIWFVQLLP